MNEGLNPPPLPRQTLAELQTAGHLHNLKILFYALAVFHWLAALCFLAFVGIVAFERGLDDGGVLATVYAAVAVLAALLGLLQLRTARLLGQRSNLGWCRGAAWAAVLAGPLGMALTAYAVYFLRKPEIIALFDRGDHVSL